MSLAVFWDFQAADASSEPAKTRLRRRWRGSWFVLQGCNWYFERWRRSGYCCKSANTLHSGEDRRIAHGGNFHSFDYIADLSTAKKLGFALGTHTQKSGFSGTGSGPAVSRWAGWVGVAVTTYQVGKFINCVRCSGGGSPGIGGGGASGGAGASGDWFLGGY